MVTNTKRRWGRALALGMGTAVLPAVLAPQPLWAQEARIAYDIPPQPLAGALMRFSQVSGMQVFFDPAALRGKSSAGARGALSRGQPLAALMAGSGLAYSIEGNAARISAPRAGAVTGAPAGGVLLDPVTLNASDSGTTAAQVPMDEPVIQRVNGMMATSRMMKGVERTALTTVPTTR